MIFAFGSSITDIPTSFQVLSPSCHLDLLLLFSVYIKPIFIYLAV